MTVFASLKALLMDNLVEPISQKDGRYFVRLKEDGADARLRKVNILDVPEGSLLIQLDKVEQPKTLFKGQLGERQRCDYVLATVIHRQPFIIFIELKSKIVKNSDVTKQFKGAECLLDYCDAALNRFHGEKDLLGRCEKRFIVFYKPTIAKQRTRPIFSDKRHQSPDSPLKYPSPRNPSLMVLVKRAS